jgi:hypothetical protein
MPGRKQKSITISHETKESLEKNYVKYLRTCNQTGYIGTSFTAFVVEMSFKGFTSWRNEQLENIRRLQEKE